MNSRYQGALLFVVTLLALFLVLGGRGAVPAYSGPHQANGGASSGTAELVARYRGIEDVSNVAVQGDYAYVLGVPRNDESAQPSGMHVLDLSHPVTPTQVAFLELPFKHVRDMVIAGNYVYCLVNSGLVIIDVSTPTSPRQAGTYFGGPVSRMTVAGNYVYLAGWAGFSIVDVSNPAEPVHIGSYETESGGALDIEVVGDYAYMPTHEAHMGGLYSYGMHIVDVSTPTAPQATYTLEHQWEQEYGQLDVAGDYLFTTVGSVLRAFNIADRSAPELVDEHAGLTTPGDIVVADGYAYVTDWGDLTGLWPTGGGLHIFDVSDPADIKKAAFYSTIGSPHHLAINAGLVYLTAGEEGLYILRYPSFPVHLPLIWR
jgi:hypothetical protein